MPAATGVSLQLIQQSRPAPEATVEQRLTDRRPSTVAAQYTPGQRCHKVDPRHTAYLVYHGSRLRPKARHVPCHLNGIDQVTLSIDQAILDRLTT
jgi:hypothetical protein